MEGKISNPRMHNPDGVYVAEARQEDCFTMRDYFAAKALQGHMASEYYVGHNNTEGAESIARTMYMFADAMLKERSKTNE